MKQYFRNPWFLLACGFLIVNSYAVFRMGRTEPPKERPAGRAEQHVIDMPDLQPQSAQQRHMQIRNLQQVDVDEKGNSILALTFDRKVSPNVLKRFVRVTGSEQGEVPFKVQDSGVASTIFLTVTAASNAAITVEIKQGFYADEGPERLRQNLVRSIMLQPDIALTSLNVNTPPFQNPTVVLHFSQPVDLGSLRESLSTEPHANLVITEQRHWHHGRTYFVTGDLQHNRNYTLQIAAGLKGRSSNARLRAAIEEPVFIPDAQTAMRIPVEGRFLSPHGNMLLPLQSINVTDFTVSAARLPAHNLVQFAMREGGHYRYHRGNEADHITIPEVDVPFTLDAPANSNIHHYVSLEDVLKENMSHGAWHISVSAADRTYDQRLLVISDIGITVRHTPSEMLVWANSIHSLDPMTNATVQVWSEAASLLLEGETDAEGLARLRLDGKKLKPFMVTVAKDDDLAFISLQDSLVPQPQQRASRPYLPTSLKSAEVADTESPALPMEAFVYTDRGVYRPGEVAHVRAILRGAHLALPAAIPVTLQAIRPDGREHSQQTAMLSSFGTAAFIVPWNDFDATGRYRLQIRTPGAQQPLGSTTIALEDFVPPRMAVDVNTKVSELASQAMVTVAARYLYGAPAANNRFGITMHAVPTEFAPAGFDDYAFGNPDFPRKSSTHEIASGNLTDDGTTETRFELPADLRPPAMLEAIITATVHEQGGRTVSAAARTPMHVYPYYIGIRKSDMRNLEPGKNRDVTIQLVSLQGKPHAGEIPVSVFIEQVSWSTVLTRDSNGHYRYESHERITPLYSDVIHTDTNGVAIYELHNAHTGRLRLRAESPDGPSTLYAYHVRGAGWRDRAMDRPDRVELEWDRPSYRPGDTAILTVTAPFAGRALLVTEQDRLLYHETRLMEENTATFHIPVTDAYFPNAHASVHVIRSLSPEDPTGSRTAARALGSIPLRLDPEPHSLKVDITAPQQSRPDSKLPITITVQSPDQRPAHAEVAIAVVDEAICMLTDFQTPNPIEHFMALRHRPFLSSDLYAMLLPEIDPDLANYHAHTGGDIGALLRGRLNPIRSRRFRPLAIWESAVETDSEGHAKIEIPIPEFSGKVRIMAVAVGHEHIGSAEQFVTISRPFTMLASLPRFLATEDYTQMPIEFHHNGEDTIPVSLEIRSDGPLHIMGNTNYTFDVAVNERFSLDIPMRADARKGVAHIQITATTPNEVITDKIELPIRPPVAYRTGHQHIALDAGESLEIPTPSNWYPDTLTQSIRVTTNNIIRLEGAYEFLTRYPYGCLEQVLSTAFAVLRTKDLSTLDTSEFRITDPDAYLRTSMNRIFAMQNANGGFGWWPHARNPYEWGSIYAMHFLTLAGKEGLRTPPVTYDRGIQYLRSLLSRSAPSQLERNRANWQKDAALRAYACYVLALAETPNHSWMNRLLEQVEHMNADSRLHLVKALAASGRRRDAYNLLRSLDHMDIPREASDRGTLASPARSIALHLSAWLAIDHQHPSIPEQVDKLLAHQQNGRWRTTQENAAALQALAKHILLTQDTPQDFTASLTQQEKEINLLPASGKIALDATLPIRIENEGPGRLYANIRTYGLPKDNTQDVDEGIRIRRTYWNIAQERIDAASVRQGDLIIIGLEVDTMGRNRDNLVIADLLPAGLEIESANLRTNELVPWAKSRNTLPVRHVDNRDDRLIIFTEPFSGTRQYYYAVRAVTPGTYIRPPVTIEGMYTPEIHSTHHAGELKVLP